MRPVMNPLCDRYNQAGGGIGIGTPGGAWAWLNGMKTWAGMVSVGNVSVKESAGLGMVIDL